MLFTSSSKELHWRIWEVGATKLAVQQIYHFTSSEAPVLGDLASALATDYCSATARGASAVGATGALATAITTASTLGSAGTPLKGGQLASDTLFATLSRIFSVEEKRNQNTMCFAMKTYINCRPISCYTATKSRNILLEDITLAEKLVRCHNDDDVCFGKVDSDLAQLK